MTAAPASKAMRMHGTEARMRVSSLMWPWSSKGTFKSARMKTRWPLAWPWAHRSAKRMMFMGSGADNLGLILGGGCGVVFGGGLAIGMLMLALTLTGALDWLARVVPRVVVRGMQCGLGLQLGRIAVAEYVPSAGVGGYALAAVAFAVVVLLMGNRRWPPAPLVLALGAVFALTMGGASPSVLGAVGLHLPVVHVPTSGEMWTGFVLLALPQIPLSLGNSVLATRQVAMDLFPEREPLSVRRIGITYSLMNVVSALVSGVPVCHGSGGMAGHYAFGGRTGGSVIIAGVTLATVGLLFGGSIGQIALFFPKPMLGVLLLFEGVAILSLLRDLGGDSRELSLALFLGVVAAGLPYGYLVAMVLGTVLAKANVRLARA